MHSVIPASFVSQVSRRSNTEKERNLISALFSIIVMMLLMSAVAIPDWYNLKGGGCTRQALGTEQFFSFNAVRTLTVPADEKNVSYSKLAYYGLNEDMKNCLTSEIVIVQRIIIGLCVVAIFFNFFQFYFDISGTENIYLNFARRYGLGSILSVIMIVIIIGLCYYVSDLMEQQQEATKLYLATRVEVTFGFSYYVISTAGLVSVLAASSNLLRCDHLSGTTDVSMLIDESQEEETFSTALPHSLSWSHMHLHNNACINNLPPPPYAP